MKRNIPLVLLFLITNYCLSQEIWDFPASEINQGAYKITDTIYMSPTGSDSNSGTIDQPVATFQKALALLPFGKPGINGGHAYGLVRLLEGIYIVDSGLQQYNNQYAKNNTFKNVSVEGIGNVIVTGTNEKLASGHMIKLLGSHVFIKNLTLKKGAIHGVFINAEHVIEDVLVENVVVDSVKSFSMLCVNAKNIRVRNSKFLRGSRIMNDSLVSGPDCQWPSGLKFLECQYVQAFRNEVAYTRGEGLNFHNSQYGLAYDNLLHDNPSNVYCDNSARIIIRNNLIYSTPGFETYWKTCPADPVDPDGSTGVLLANEGSCGGQSVFYGNCNTNCPFSGKVFPQIDSIFIWNNIFLNNGKPLSIWQGNTAPLGGPNCVRNVFFEHNTVAGLVGKDKSAKASSIYAYFASPYNQITGIGFATAQNIQVRANLFLLPKVYSNADLIDIRLHNTFPVPFDIHFEDNLTNLYDERLEGNNTLREDMPTKISLHQDSFLYSLTPCSDNNPLLIHKVALNERTPYDYRYDTRTINSANAGALNFFEFCTLNIDYKKRKVNIPFKVYPNPVSTKLNIQYLGLDHSHYTLKLYNMNGVLIQEEAIQYPNKMIDISKLENGLYFLELHHKQEITILKFIKL